MRVESSSDGISGFIRRNARQLFMSKSIYLNLYVLYFSPTWDYNEMVSNHKLEGEFSLRPNIVATLLCDFQPPEQ